MPFSIPSWPSLAWPSTSLPQQTRVCQGQAPLAWADIRRRGHDGVGTERVRALPVPEQVRIAVDRRHPAQVGVEHFRSRRDFLLADHVDHALHALALVD